MHHPSFLPHRGELITNYYHIFAKCHSQSSCSSETLHATNWQRLQIIQLVSNINQQSRKQAVIFYFSVIDYAWSVAIKNICKWPLKTWSCFWIPLWGRIADGDRWVAVCSMCVKFRIALNRHFGWWLMQMSRNETDRKMACSTVKTLSLSTALSYYGEYWGNDNTSEIMFEMFEKVSWSLPCGFSAVKAKCSAGFWVQSKADFHV